MSHTTRSTSLYADVKAGDKMSQPPLGQAYSSNSKWQTNDIWGNNVTRNGFMNGLRDASSTRAESNEFGGISGSGALAASSEADPWAPRPSWPPSNVSPPSQSGATSPTRHRGSNPSVTTSSILSESQKTSPYLTTSRPAIGQGPGTNVRSQAKSNLDPASGSFKYPFDTPSFPFGDNKENFQQHSGAAEVLKSFAFDHRAGRSGDASTSRDPSLPPSVSGMSNGSLLPNNNYGFGPTGSFHSQRPSTARTNSYQSPVTGSGFNERSIDTDSTFGRNLLNQNDTTQTAFLEHLPTRPEQSLHSPGVYSNYNLKAQRLNGATSLWSHDDISSKSAGDHLTDNHTNSTYSDYLSSKQSRTDDRVPKSPQEAFQHHHHQYQQASPRGYVGTVSSVAQHSYGRIQGQQDTSELERQMQRLQFSSQGVFPSPQAIYAGQFQNRYPLPPYDYTITQYRSSQPQSQYVATSVSPYSASGPPRGPARDQDLGHGVRSLLLEEFRSNQKTNRRYELKDIYDHVVEFSGDQHGSRFIQQKLETANSDEKERLFREIQPNALQLMTDVFGNYVIQKLFEHGNQVQKKVLAETMKHHVHELSQQMYGCRVVQKALEYVLVDQQAALVRELQVDVLSCVKDQNGNHVVQKAIERVPAEHIQFIIEAFRGQVNTLATHPYGCRVIQRMLEYCSAKDQASVLEELFNCASILIPDQYGNYVIQHVIQHGKPEDRARIIDIVNTQLITLSKHKFASNVVEKCITFSSDSERRAIVSQITALSSDSSSPLQSMMKDQYGNYVVQKLLTHLKGEERDRFIEDIKPQLAALKKYNYCKQIAAIEKVIFAGGPSLSSSVPNQSIPRTSTTVSETMPVEIHSSAPTPMLTMEQSSPQSSSLPSTNASTADGPTGSEALPEKAVPQVRVETAEVAQQSIKI